MQFLKKLGLGLALLLYGPLLLALPTIISLNATLNEPSFVKQTLVDAKLYPALAGYVEEQVAKSTELNASPLFSSSFKEIFTSAALQKVFEPTVDSTYTWLDNPEKPFDISIDIKPLLEDYKARVNEKFLAQVTALPKCSARLQPTSTNPYELNCIPPSLSIDAIRTQAEQQFAKQTEELSKQGTISLTDPEPETTPTAEQPQDSASSGPDASKTEAPKFEPEQFKKISAVYRATKASTPYLIGLLILTTAGIVGLSITWIAGIKRTGILLVINGGLLFAGSAVSAFLLKTLLPIPATEGNIGDAGREVANLLSRHMLMTMRNFAVGYLIVGVIAIIAAVILKRKFGTAKPKPENIEAQNMLPKEKPEPVAQEQKSTK